MRKYCFALALACGCFAYPIANAGEVKLTWQDPDNYTDIRPSNETREGFREQVFQSLGQVFADLAKKLPDDVTWNVTVTDVDLAGDVRPGMRPGGGDIRIIKDIYWPRMSFNYTMIDAKGAVIAQGKEDIADMSFLMTRPFNISSSNFPYETKMLDDWFRKQVKNQRFPVK